MLTSFDQRLLQGVLRNLEEYGPDRGEGASRLSGDPALASTKRVGCIYDLPAERSLGEPTPTSSKGADRPPKRPSLRLQARKCRRGRRRSLACFGAISLANPRPGQLPGGCTRPARRTGSVCRVAGGLPCGWGCLAAAGESRAQKSRQSAALSFQHG